MKRIIIGLLLTVALVFGLTACDPGTGVYVFGDSLISQSTPALQRDLPGVTVNSYGGTAVCDWSARMKTTADAHPKIVIASFVGNSLTPCSHGPKGTDAYWTAMFLTVLDVSSYYESKHVPLYWAGYPVPGAVYSLAEWKRVQSNYQYASTQYPSYVHWFDAGLTVAPNHVYTCCINGKTVRQPDKLHLTPDGAELYARELVKPAIS